MSTIPPEFAGCLWPVDPSCQSAKWDALDPDVRTLSLAYASATLERLTAYRVGNCPIKLRPDLGGCYVDAQGPSYGALSPTNWNGRWTTGWGGCRTPACEIALPPPVGRIDAVVVDGALVDPDDYALQNGNLLVWVGAGDCPWVNALFQDMSLPDSEPGTMSVTYLNAYPVDSVGANAVTLLALEFAKACAGAKCDLPGGVTTLVRQGVTMQLVASGFTEGKTGIRAVDAFIGLWNPRMRTRPGMIYSPDLPQHRVDNRPSDIVADGGGP